MAADSHPAVALLPIQPRYATAILRGEKRVEFRRRNFARDVEYVVIYASSPIKRILGFFRVSAIAEGCPAEMWDRYHQEGAIEEEAYLKYYDGALRAVAIEIDRVCVLDNPLPLSAIRDSMKPPQSYVYVSYDILERLSAASQGIGHRVTGEAQAGGPSGQPQAA